MAKRNNDFLDDDEDTNDAGIGHNSGGAGLTVEGKRLMSFIERLERLQEEKSGIAEDIKDVFAEAKAVGYDTKTIRKILTMRKQAEDKRREEEHLLETYLAALGMG